MKSIQKTNYNQVTSTNKSISPINANDTLPNLIIATFPTKITLKNFKFNTLYKETLKLSNLMDFTIILNLVSTDPKKIYIKERIIKLTANQTVNLTVKVFVKSELNNAQFYKNSAKHYILIRNEMFDYRLPVTFERSETAKLNSLSNLASNSAGMQGLNSEKEYYGINIEARNLNNNNNQKGLYTNSNNSRDFENSRAVMDIEVNRNNNERNPQKNMFYDKIENVKNKLNEQNDVNEVQEIECNEDYYREDDMDAYEKNDDIFQGNEAYGISPTTTNAEKKYKVNFLVKNLQSTTPFFNTLKTSNKGGINILNHNNHNTDNYEENKQNETPHKKNYHLVSTQDTQGSQQTAKSGQMLQITPSNNSKLSIVNKQYELNKLNDKICQTSQNQFWSTNSEDVKKLLSISNQANDNQSFQNKNKKSGKGVLNRKLHTLQSYNEPASGSINQRRGLKIRDLNKPHSYASSPIQKVNNCFIGRRSRMAYSARGCNSERTSDEIRLYKRRIRAAKLFKLANEVNSAVNLSTNKYTDLQTKNFNSGDYADDERRIQNNKHSTNRSKHNEALEENKIYRDCGLVISPQSRQIPNHYGQQILNSQRWSEECNECFLAGNNMNELRNLNRINKKDISRVTETLDFPSHRKLGATSRRVDHQLMKMSRIKNQGEKQTIGEYSDYYNGRNCSKPSKCKNVEARNKGKSVCNKWQYDENRPRTHRPAAIPAELLQCLTERNLIHELNLNLKKSIDTKNIRNINNKNNNNNTDNLTLGSVSCSSTLRVERDKLKLQKQGNQNTIKNTNESKESKENNVKYKEYLLKVEYPQKNQNKNDQINFDNEHKSHMHDYLVTTSSLEKSRLNKKLDKIKGCKENSQLKNDTLYVNWSKENTPEKSKIRAGGKGFYTSNLLFAIEKIEVAISPNVKGEKNNSFVSKNKFNENSDTNQMNSAKNKNIETKNANSNESKISSKPKNLIQNLEESDLKFNHLKTSLNKLNNSDCTYSHRKQDDNKNENRNFNQDNKNSENFPFQEAYNKMKQETQHQMKLLVDYANEITELSSNTYTDNTKIPVTTDQPIETQINPDHLNQPAILNDLNQLSLSLSDPSATDSPITNISSLIKHQTTLLSTQSAFNSKFTDILTNSFLQQLQVIASLQNSNSALEAQLIEENEKNRLLNESKLAKLQYIGELEAVAKEMQVEKSGNRTKSGATEIKAKNMCLMCLQQQGQMVDLESLDAYIKDSVALFRIVSEKDDEILELKTKLYFANQLSGNMKAYIRNLKTNTESGNTGNISNIANVDKEPGIGVFYGNRRILSELGEEDIQNTVSEIEESSSRGRDKSNFMNLANITNLTEFSNVLPNTHGGKPLNSRHRSLANFMASKSKGNKTLFTTPSLGNTRLETTDPQNHSNYSCNFNETYNTHKINNGKISNNINNHNKHNLNLNNKYSREAYQVEDTATKEENISTYPHQISEENSSPSTRRNLFSNTSLYNYSNIHNSKYGPHFENTAYSKNERPQANNNNKASRILSEISNLTETREGGNEINNNENNTFNTNTSLSTFKTTNTNNNTNMNLSKHSRLELSHIRSTQNTPRNLVMQVNSAIKNNNDNFKTSPNNSNNARYVVNAYNAYNSNNINNNKNKVGVNQKIKGSYNCSTQEPNTELIQSSSSTDYYSQHTKPLNILNNNIQHKKYQGTSKPVMLNSKNSNNLLFPSPIMYLGSRNHEFPTTKPSPSSLVTGKFAQQNIFINENDKNRIKSNKNSTTTDKMFARKGDQDLANRSFGSYVNLGKKSTVNDNYYKNNFCKENEDLMDYKPNYTDVNIKNQYYLGSGVLNDFNDENFSGSD